MSILQTSAVNHAGFGHCHPTLATFNHADWLADPRSAKADQGVRQLQADAKAKRSGIAAPHVGNVPDNGRGPIRSSTWSDSISRRIACDGLFRRRGCGLVGGERTKIDRLLPIVVETEQIPNRLNFPLNSRARISDGSWIRCFEVREEVSAARSRRYHAHNDRVGVRGSTVE